jgi:hypothetical protein
VEFCLYFAAHHAGAIIVDSSSSGGSPELKATVVLIGFNDRMKRVADFHALSCCKFSYCVFAEYLRITQGEGIYIHVEMYKKGTIPMCQERSKTREVRG